MADPKIEYDIEAGTTGRRSFHELANLHNGMADFMESDVNARAFASADSLGRLSDRNVPTQFFDAIEREVSDHSPRASDTGE